MVNGELSGAVSGPEGVMINGEWVWARKLAFRFHAKIAKEKHAKVAKKCSVME